MSLKVIEEESRIQSLDSSDLLNNGIVMDKIAKDLTRQYCEIVAESKGDILDVGFGLGFSANFFYELGVQSYTCIEIDEQIYRNALEWAKDKPNVTILKGDWINIVPTLDRKFDGIFMDTYGDDHNKYRQFPMYAKLIAKENCCLSLWEYKQIESLEKVNYKVVEVDQKDYELLLRPYHIVAWSYFVAGEFRKDRWYDYHRGILPEDLCEELIEQNKERATREFTQARIDDILHTRELSFCKLAYNERFEKIINEQLLPRYKFLNLDKADCIFYAYKEGHRYDRHVETVKYIKIGDKNQRAIAYEFLLNEDFTGGALDIYDIWLNSDRDNFSTTTLRKGDAVGYRPYQHVENRPIESGVRYSVILFVRNQDMEIKRTLI